MDGILLGAMLVMFGIAIGGVGVWAIERWHDAERAALLRAIGHMQGTIQDMQDANIPEEEL